MTDQCPAMKQAIPIAFRDSKHRLCLWHITNKFEDKVCSKFICMCYHVCSFVVLISLWMLFLLVALCYDYVL